MGASLDLRKAHKTRLHGDILAVNTWINGERSLVLLPAHRAMGSPWYVVQDSAAYKYDDPQYLARSARKAAEVLGMDETTSTWFRIAKIIDEGLADLIRMPHEPDDEVQQAALGAIKIMEDHRQVGEQLIHLPTAGKVEFGAANG